MPYGDHKAATAIQRYDDDKITQESTVQRPSWLLYKLTTGGGTKGVVKSGHHPNRWFIDDLRFACSLALSARITDAAYEAFGLSCRRKENVA